MLSSAQRRLYDPIRPSLEGENAGGKLAFWGAILVLWICIGRNQVQGPRDRGNTVERCLDRLSVLGMVRFRRLLSFHLYFQLRLLSQALKMGVLDRDAGFSLPRSGGMVFQC